MLNIPQRQREAIEANKARVRKIFAILDADPAGALALSEDARSSTARVSGEAVDDDTALAGIHRARIIVGRDARASAAHGVTKKHVEASLSWLAAHGFKADAR